MSDFILNQPKDAIFWEEDISGEKNLRIKVVPAEKKYQKVIYRTGNIYFSDEKPQWKKNLRVYGISAKPVSVECSMPLKGTLHFTRVGSDINDKPYTFECHSGALISVSFSVEIVSEKLFAASHICPLTVSHIGDIRSMSINEVKEKREKTFSQEVKCIVSADYIRIVEPLLPKSISYPFDRSCLDEAKKNEDDIIKRLNILIGDRGYKVSGIRINNVLPMQNDESFVKMNEQYEKIKSAKTNLINTQLNVAADEIVLDADSKREDIRRKKIETEAMYKKTEEGKDDAVW